MFLFLLFKIHIKDFERVLSGALIFLPVWLTAGRTGFARISMMVSLPIGVAPPVLVS
jgi:hypothetical protein